MINLNYNNASQFFQYNFAGLNYINDAPKLNEYADFNVKTDRNFIAKANNNDNYYANKSLNYNSSNELSINNYYNNNNEFHQAQYIKNNFSDANLNENFNHNNSNYYYNRNYNHYNYSGYNNNNHYNNFNDKRKYNSIRNNNNYKKGFFNNNKRNYNYNNENNENKSFNRNDFNAQNYNKTISSEKTNDSLNYPYASAEKMKNQIAEIKAEIIESNKSLELSDEKKQEEIRLKEFISKNYESLLQLNSLNKGVSEEVKKQAFPKFFIIKSFNEEDFHKVNKLFITNDKLYKTQKGIFMFLFEIFI